MKEQFQRILEEIRLCRPASLELEAEGRRYTRVFEPKERLILLGGGHVALSLCRLASSLGFSVTVVDDRPDFANTVRFPEANRVICDEFSNAIRRLSLTERDYVALMTRGHRWDGECLRAVYSGEIPHYVGMLASKRRGIGMKRQLLEEGYPAEVLEQLHTPIGLDIGALTVEEIAISIASELIQCRRQEVSRRSHSDILVQKDIPLLALISLAENDQPQALLLVLETRGSTPVKSGALMVIDQNLRGMGTIGGGCGEADAMRKAWRLIGTGTQKIVTVSLDNELAGDEGMVCGGEMKLLLMDIV